MARISVHLPAFGRPSSPTSASSFSSSFRCRASPGVPLVVLRGARLVELLKRVLPRPPRPPSATFSRAPSSARSPSTSPVSTSATMVPTGTLTVRSSPERPVLFRPAPPSPLSARNLRCTRKSASVLMPWSACSQTLPPWPPSPPSGPPRGMYFSRRKLRQPWPPLPACTRMVASSTNFMGISAKRQKNPAAAGFSQETGVPRSGTRARLRLRRSGVDDAHVLAALRSLLLEQDLAVGLGEQRVVPAEAHVGAGMEAGAPLAHEDVACHHGLAAEELHAQSFGF